MSINKTEDVGIDVDLSHNSQTELGRDEIVDKIASADEEEGQQKTKFGAVNIRTNDPSTRRDRLTNLKLSLSSLRPAKTGRQKAMKKSLLHRIHILSKQM